MDDRLVRIETKLDGLATSNTKIMAELAAQRIAEENHQRNIERFWGQTWPDVIEKLDKNATKIAEMEVTVAELRTKMVIWGGALTVGVPILAIFLENLKIGS